MGFLSDLFGGKNGPVGTYYSNGQVEWKGTKKKGSSHGPYEFYDETGQLTTKGTYKEGLRIGKWIKMEALSKDRFSGRQRTRLSPQSPLLRVRLPAGMWALQRSEQIMLESGVSPS